MANIHLLIALFTVLMTAHCDRTSKKIYYTFDSTGSSYSACFRRMNGTHQFGCTSGPKGNVGVVHYIMNETDMSWLLNSGPHAPYAVLLNPPDFNRVTVQKLLNSGKVNGIMVLNNMDKYPVDSFSPDDTCPNKGYGLYANDTDYQGCSKVQWNPYGEGLMMLDLSIPIFTIKLSEENDTKNDAVFLIKECYEKYNKPHADGTARDYPLCAVELKDRMDGAKDSETCIRRSRYQANLDPQQYCDPLGDYNVYGTVKAITNEGTRPQKSVIIAAARLDTFSMFYELYPGADSAISGIITLLAAAEAIGKVKHEIQAANLSHDIMFTFFNGEAFDYIGSDRMVYDMTYCDFPKKNTNLYLSQINLTHISHFVEVSQLAHRDAGKLWLHTDPLTSSKVQPQLDHLISLFLEANSSLVAAVNNSNPLPPASVQSFLRVARNTTLYKNLPLFPAVVLADHKTAYTNKYYNSRLDLQAGINLHYKGSKETWYDQDTEVATNLTEAADMLANVLFKLAMNGTAMESAVAVNKTTVKHLLYCFLEAANCEILRDIFEGHVAKTLPNMAYPLYVGVDYRFNNFTNVVQQLLIYFLGDRVPEEYCNGTVEIINQTVYNYAWMQGPQNENGSRNEEFCMRATVNVSVAVSKAFDNNEYKSNKYSTWTESKWDGDNISIRLFLIPSKAFETITLVVGLVVLILSLLLTYFLNKRVHILFSRVPDDRPHVSYQAVGQSCHTESTHL